MKKLTSEDPRSAGGAHLAGGGAVKPHIRITLGMTALVAASLDDPRTDRTGRRSPLLAPDVIVAGSTTRARRYVVTVDRAREIRAWVADCPALWDGEPGQEAARERAAIRRTLAVIDRAIAQEVAQ